MKTFILALHERQEEANRALAHCKERGIEGAELVYGINAAVAGLETSHPYLVDHPEENFHIGPKLTGVWLGHMMLWTVCAAMPDSHFLLLEYDVVLAEDFREKMVQAIRDVPEDFDFLFMGSCCTAGHPKTHIKGSIYQMRQIQCNHAMIVAKKCLPYVISMMQKCYAPVDCALVLDVFPALKTYVHLPRVATQQNTEIPP